MPIPSLPQGLALTPSQHAAVMALMVDRHQGDIAASTLPLWSPLAKSLVTIIGQDGFLALLDRSLHVAGEAFPWLLKYAPGAPISSRLEGLQSALSGRAADEATQAMVLLLSTFTGVLATLIGTPLTTNILRTAWGQPFADAVQELTK